MVFGKLVYNVTIGGLQLLETTAKSTVPEIEEVKLVSKNSNSLEVEFKLRGILGYEEAENLVHPVLEAMLNHLAFKFDFSVGEPQLRHIHLPQDESETSALSMTSFDTARIVTRADKELSEEERGKLSSELGKLTEPNSLYSAYRFAANHRDEVAKFMFLYNIVLQTQGDAQPAVDTFIRTKEPNVTMTPSPHASGKVETIYTRLRNEVAHVRSNATPPKTREEIRQNVDGLRKLVKLALT